MMEAKQGLAFAPKTAEELSEALEMAFDYRGDVTLTLNDGSRVEGYLYDRQAGVSAGESSLKLIPKDRPGRLRLRYSEIAGIEFSGRDTAAGKRWEDWVKGYLERKRAGERNIELTPESLD